MSRLNAQQLRDLRDELTVLKKQQSEARLLEVFIRMNEREVKAFELRTPSSAHLPDSRHSQ